MKMKLIKKPLVGIDIGSRSVKGVQLSKTKNGVRLARYFFSDLLDLNPDFPQKNSPQEALKAAVEINRLKNNRAAINLKDEDVLHLNLHVPQLPQKELELAVSHEVQEHLSIPKNELCFDYEVIESLDDSLANSDPAASAPATQEGSDKLLDVSVFCTKRDRIEERLSWVETAHLRPESAEPDLLAITAMLAFNDYLPERGSVVVFDLGESHMSAGLITDRRLILSRSGKTGCGAVNQALSQCMRMSYQEAEVKKLRYDFTLQSESPEPESKAIDDQYTEIFREMKESIDYFRESTEPMADIKQILLLGGGSQIRNIHKVTELFFKIPTTIANSFRNIDLYSTEHGGATGDAIVDIEEINRISAFMGTAVGLALREGE